MKNIEDNSMERTAELTPAESETLLRGHVWQQPENENLVCGAISSVIGARENQQDSCYMDIEPDGNSIGIVCDGMGGLKGGEIASQQAVCMFVEDDMVCVTKEHNYLMLLNKQLEEGTIDEEEYAREVKRGAALISYLGMGNVNLMDANPNPLPLEDGDIVVLCSDGLYKALSDAQIYEIISKNADDLEAAVQELQMQAQISAGRVQDNTSIVVLSYRPNV